MRIAAAVILGILFLVSAAVAQTSCDDALQQAKKSYDLGLFEDVHNQLDPCMKARLSRATTIEVHLLLARSYLMADELERARREVSAILRLDSTFEGAQPPRFAALVAQVKREEQTTQVASVSKTNESLREAPATVVVVTADEIQRRGYLDLEQLLHDLPGFDISRLNGKIYSNIYQRGYRSANNDRLILLVDGVEQNELSSNTLYLSRQYPLTNIDRVEVIYGPASTMYGANAYTGVISILTRDPENLIGEGQTFGVASQITSGGYGEQTGDVTAAGRDRNGTVAWSIAANFQRSHERNLSSFADWDYTYRNVDYAKLLALSDSDGVVFYRKNCLQPTQYSQYLQCIDSSHVAPSPAGVDLIRSLDAALIRENGLGFDDRAANWSLNGKLRLSNLTLGVQTWRSREGIASQYRAVDLGGDTSWTPAETALYVKYSLPLDRMNLNFFARYLQTSIERSGSTFDYLHLYAKDYLSLASLIPPCKTPSDTKPQGCAPAHPWVETVTFGSIANQLRAEMNGSFDSWERLKVIAGAEVAKSSIPSQLEQQTSGPGLPLFHTTDVNHPSEQIEHTDIAVFAQGSWKPRPSVKVVFAGRVSHNEINNKPGAAGYGTLFTPRAGIIVSPPGKHLVMKAIYSEAFKDPTDAEKFGRLADVNAFASFGLKPERVRNTELSAAWEPSESLSLDTSLYRARYSDVVGLVAVNGCDGTGCLRYANRDEILVSGLQATARYAFRAAELWANYTHTDPRLTNPDDPRFDHLRVADVASDHLNAGIDVHWHRWNAGVRAQYVGARSAGEGTTEPRNPFSRMDPYSTTDLTISYHGLIRGATLQLSAQNVFDKQYYDPGTDPLAGVARVPQAGRTVYLRLVVGRR